MNASNVLLVTCVETSPLLHFQVNVRPENIVMQEAKVPVYVKLEHSVQCEGHLPQIFVSVVLLDRFVIAKV